MAIARSLINDPYIILADEATGNLDTATSHEIMEMLGKLNDAGKTIIMVTHEDDIADHAKRIIRMRDGLIIDDKPSPRMQAATGRADGHGAPEWTRWRPGQADETLPQDAELGQLNQELTLDPIDSGEVDLPWDASGGG